MKMCSCSYTKIDLMRRIVILFALCLCMTSVFAQMPGNGQFQMGNNTSGGMMGSNNNMQNGQKRSQNNEDDDKPEPVVVVIKDQGLSFGIDLSPFIIRLINEERTGVAFVGRYGFAKRWWAGAEMGFENVKYDKASYTEDDQGNKLPYDRQIFKYKSNGTFIRVGADYDIYMSDEYPTNNNILVGARYGYAWQMHESSAFEVPDNYWGAYKGSVESTPVNTHWLEGLFGLRCEMLPNFYMSWTFRARVRLLSTHSDDLNPYAIAGLGKYDNRVAMGFTYTLEYQIPTNRKLKR